MSKKERKQLIVFDKLKQGEITQVEAALKLGISTRWVREKHKRYVSQGATGLVHANRGKLSPLSWDDAERVCALELLRGDWQGFGPTFAAKKLRQLKGISISKETLRKAMIEDGVWRGKKRRMKHRKRRERRDRLGHMVQLDGSPHDWFEGRGPNCTLLVFIDDATSRFLWLQFVTGESTLEVMRSTQNYVMRHGVPQEFYVDHGSVFHVNLNNPERDKKTQWERAVMSLGSKIIHALSPQAKGRVERANRTLQDHLVKEFRLAGVSSIEEANKFLKESSFIHDHNATYAVNPDKQGDIHKPLLTDNLKSIFCIKEERVLTNDHTVTYKGRIFQLAERQPAIIRPKDKVIINTHLDNSITLSVRKVDLAFHELSELPTKPKIEKIVKPYKPRKPNENSRRWVAGMLPRYPRGQAPGRVG